MKRTIAVIAIVSALAGCATTPRPDPCLGQTGEAYRNCLAWEAYEEQARAYEQAEQYQRTSDLLHGLHQTLQAAQPQQQQQRRMSQCQVYGNTLQCW